MPSISRGQVTALFGSIVGDGNIITDYKQIHEAQTSTYKTSQKILGIVKPSDVKQLQAIVKTAKWNKIPIHVYSTGKNWGYGSRIPNKSGSMLVDLGRMNKIISYDEELGYVTVEPGVTQKQLYDFLQEKGSSFSVSTTGSAPDTSIIGNVCERGVGAGPYGFRSRYIGSLEVVLPSGKCIHTGFGRFTNAKASGVYPEGIGPSFCDMFIQSNYGIVTKLTILLVPTPNYSRIIDIPISRDEDLEKYVGALRTFNFRSTSKKFINFRKDLQALLTKTQYPWHLTGDETPLPTAVTDQLKKEFNVDYAWKALVVIYGYTEQEVDAQVSYLTSLMKHLDGFSVSPLYTENTLGNRPRAIGDGSYWRMKTKPPEVKNPDTDGCGLIRLSIAVPFTPNDIVKVVGLMNNVITQFKYEPFIEGHCISERVAIIIAPIIFDRTVPGEDENALACHDALLKQLIKAGYYPYRDNGRAMGLFPKSSDDYDDFQRIIKDALDPGNILSPGKYESSARLRPGANDLAPRQRL